MKHILILIFSLLFKVILCQAQSFAIGASKKEMIEQLEKQKVKFTFDSTANTLIYQSGYSKIKCIIENDIVSYVNITSDAKYLNRTIQFYNSTFVNPSELHWINYNTGLAYDMEEIGEDEFTILVRKK